MKRCRVFAYLFGVIGICVAVLTVTLAFRNIHTSPVLMGQQDAAREQVTVMMDAVCRGDYDAASEVIRGKPVFGVEEASENRVSAIVWDAFAKSVSYELEGELYATDYGVTQNVKVTTLDLSSVTGNLKERSEKLLAQRVAAAEDPNEVYDSNSEYREELVEQVLYDAVRAALRRDAKTVTVDVAVHLVYEEGSWWVAADSALLSAISGGVLK